MQDKRISYISYLQIAGPIFVVLGHSLNGLEAVGAWYVFSKEWIYLFHMPLFFFISGYLLSFKGYLGNKTYGRFLLGKCKRLLIPYLVWNLLFWVPKIFAQDLIFDSAPLNIAEALRAFVFPRQNVWGHTWFLPALFLVYSAAPLFRAALRPKRPWLSAGVVAVCVVLYLLPDTTEFLAWSDLHKDLLFFVIGCLLGQTEPDRLRAEMKRLRVWFFVGAIGFSAVALVWYEQTTALHFIPCCFILAALLSVFMSIEHLPAFCDKLASCSFGIYIMHWPVMLAVRIVLQQMLHADLALTAAAMIAAGYIVPILAIFAFRALPLGRLKQPLNILLGV